MRFLCISAGLILLSPMAMPAQESNGAAGNDPLTYVKKGVAQNAKGDFNGATDSFNRALELDPTDSAAYEGRGETHLAQGELTDALNDFNKALDLAPNDEPALYHRAVVEAKNGDFDKAVADDDRIVDSSTLNAAETANVFLQRGRIKYLKGDFDGALADATQAGRLSPKLAEASFVRGVAENAKGNYAAAAIDLATASLGGMLEAPLWFWIAKMNDHNEDEAAAQMPPLLAKAIGPHPNPWIKELGDLLLEKTTSTQVLNDMQAGPAGSERPSQAWFFTAISREFSGDASGAKQAYQKAIDLGAPDSYRTVEAKRRLKNLSS